jgi:hypothetical protein
MAAAAARLGAGREFLRELRPGGVRAAGVARSGRRRRNERFVNGWRRFLAFEQSALDQAIAAMRPAGRKTRPGVSFAHRHRA